MYILPLTHNVHGSLTVPDAVGVNIFEIFVLFRVETRFYFAQFDGPAPKQESRPKKAVLSLFSGQQATKLGTRKKAKKR